MKAAFLHKILEKHQHSEKFPPTSMMSKFTTNLMFTLFPEQCKDRYKKLPEIEECFANLKTELREILDGLDVYTEKERQNLVNRFFEILPDTYEILVTDVDAILQGDPAAKSEYEVVRAYPGFYAIFFYRIAHLLHYLGVKMIPRVITEYAHSKTGIDIHPGAQIGPYFFIDHGTGLVIGETVIIGNNVKLYQGVTLGALSVAKELANTKRHPTVEDNVVIYSGATILGGETVIGHDSIIGGNVWLTKSIPAYSTVYHKSQISVRNENQETSE